MCDRNLVYSAGNKTVITTREGQQSCHSRCVLFGPRRIGETIVENPGMPFIYRISLHNAVHSRLDLDGRMGVPSAAEDTLYVGKTFLLPLTHSRQSLHINFLCRLFPDSQSSRKRKRRNVDWDQKDHTYRRERGKRVPFSLDGGRKFASRNN